MGRFIYKDAEDLAKAAVDGNLVIKLDGKVYDTGKNVMAEWHLDSAESAMTFIFAFLHLKNIKGPEVDVMNPHPSAPKAGYIFPEDLYLDDEGDKMRTMKMDDFVQHGKELLDRGSPMIMVVADYQCGSVRTSCAVQKGTIHLDKKINPRGYTVSINTISASQRTNQEVFDLLLNDLTEWLVDNGIQLR